MSAIRIPIGEITGLDTYQTIATKLDVRDFARRPVEKRVKAKILEAARLTASSMNSQHWRFVVVEDPANLETLAWDSTSGPWVRRSSFAIIVSIDPNVPASTIDAGRVVQDMQLAAWEDGVASGVFTGIKVGEFRKHFAIPDSLDPVVVVGFGYPTKKLFGKKNRKPLSELVFLEKFGMPIGELDP